jgi:hypothetical protein
MVTPPSSNGAGPPPVGEMGQVNIGGVLPWAEIGWIDQTEHVPELTWPRSVQTYHTMRTDSQCQGLYLGYTMPIRRYNWFVSPNGARDEVVQAFADDVNLPIQGETASNKPRTRDKFHWGNFLRQALLATVYGFYYFENIGVIRDGMWHLVDIAPRPPATISQVKVDEQGALVSIKQAVGISSPEIPAARLTPMVWDLEGGNWFGRSMFRSVYKNWLIKDRLLRVDAMKHDRNGLGVPWIEAPQGATKQQIEYLNQLAQSFRAGDMSGAATPFGAKLTLVGTTGGMPDTVKSIQMHDEAMARSFLMMFMQLGQTQSGARALGESFIDFFTMTQETIALWVEETVSEFLIEDWVDWNYGEEELTPRIEHERNPDPDLAIADLVSLVANNVIHVDPELEAYIRGKYALPSYIPPDETIEPNPPTVKEPDVPPSPETPETPQPVSQQQPVTPELGNGKPPVTQSSVTVMPPREAVTDDTRRKVTRSAVSSLLPLPKRTLRRQPYPHEVQAQVDFAALDTLFDTSQASLVSAVKQGQGIQVKQLQEQIVAAKGNLDTLASIQADPVHATIIQQHMVDMASNGAKQAVTEASKQGKHIPMPDMTSANASMAQRAGSVDQVLARSLSESGARKALSLSPAQSPEMVAKTVGNYLNSLSTSYLQDQLGGTLQQALNTGRKEVFSDGDPNKLYASELLDSNTCDECTDVDGTEYPDMDAAEADYPTGGYMNCAGGPRCRGTLVGVYGEVDTTEGG